MKLSGYEDLRVQRTITNIYSAFEKLIVEKDYHKITVKELAELAQINKKTFYRYYPTLDDLLAEMQAQYSKEYLDEVGNFEYPRDLQKSIEAFITYSDKQGEAYDRITTISSGTYVGIRQQMIDTVMNKTWGQSAQFNRLDNFHRKILLKYVEQTGLTVYKQWVADGKNEPIENVIKAAQDLMQGGVDYFLDD